MTNKDRALAARDLLRWNRMKRDPGLAMAEPIDNEDIIELLVNVRHFCRWYGHHFETLDRAAYQFFENASHHDIEEGKP
jgi:hypothetical protein